MSYKGFLWVVVFSLLLSMIPAPWPLVYLRPDFLLYAFLLLGLRSISNHWIAALGILLGLLMDVSLQVPLGCHGLVYSFSYVMASHFRSVWNYYAGIQKSLLVGSLLFLSQLLFVISISLENNSLWLTEVMRLLCLNAFVWVISYRALEKLLLSSSSYRGSDHGILL